MTLRTEALARLASYWRNLVNRNRVDRDLDEELGAGLELLVDEKVRAGVHPAEARRAARLELGSLESLKDQIRDAKAGAGVDSAARDIRYALRLLKRAPGFTAIAIVTLALGIGVNTAMFGAVDAVLIRPLPYADADRLVMIWDDTSRTGSPKFFSTPPEWSEWRRHNTVFTDIAASQPGDAALSNDNEPEELPARKVTANILLTFGRRGVVLTLAGLGVGLLLAFAATRLMTTLLYGFRPAVAPLFAAVSAVLLAVAVIASIVPARRASRIDPMVALLQV